MITGGADSSVKDQSIISAFVERSASRLAGVRNGILIFGQDRASSGDIDLSLRSLHLLRRDALENERADIVELANRCEKSLNVMLVSNPSPSDFGAALDIVARIEERLLQIPLDSDGFLENVSDFVDRSFELLKVDEFRETSNPAFLNFDIDEETLEIFRSEASELTNNIANNILALQRDPNDREALWEIRRNAHTFKGAAGIVGQRDASALAHRVEDLLDQIVESKAAIPPDPLALLSQASKRLEAFSAGNDFDDETVALENLYKEFERVIAEFSKIRKTDRSSTNSPQTANHPERGPKPEAVKAASAHIVRVSLDRLDHLIKLSQELATNRNSIDGHFEELIGVGSSGNRNDIIEALRSLTRSQHLLTDEIRERLLQIRMVRFGTLETRLTRAVQVTCQEENKKAAAVFENGDCEVDTQVIDALIEPLIHLLKNAVVHGIENEETRRLIGKPDKGQIRIRVDSDDSGVTLEVSDDGRGISGTRLKQKAVQDGIITPEQAGRMNESDALDLIFQRGLTTADTINLNAGRGVGMSIVKEGVEAHGGSIQIRSIPQEGTTFTIRMPLVLRSSTTNETTVVNETAKNAIDPDSALVLLVDDSASIRRQTAKMIETAGHRVITAVDGAEAMELLLSNVWRPDLILSDVEMPVMDGWQLLECVKNTESLGDIPVVMATSLSDEAHVQLAIELGASDYKIKPLQPKDIEGIISDVLAFKAA